MPLPTPRCCEFSRRSAAETHNNLGLEGGNRGAAYAAGVSEIRRVAMVSVHTSPLEQPGTGDAGGMNVYVAEVAKELAARGLEVDIFTRATTGTIPPIAELVPGVSVRHITAGPYEGLSKQDLPGQLCAFAAGVMRAAAARPEGWYDVLHSHYWLSGQVGWLAADRWGVPLVHTCLLYTSPSPRDS